MREEEPSTVMAATKADMNHSMIKRLVGEIFYFKNAHFNLMTACCDSQTFIVFIANAFLATQCHVEVIQTCSVSNRFQCSLLPFAGTQSFQQFHFVLHRRGVEPDSSVTKNVEKQNKHPICLIHSWFFF